MHQKSKNRYLSLVAATVMMLMFAAGGLFAQLTTGKIEGTVRDTDTGQPLQGAQITIEGTRLGNVTNADGYYFILNLPPGRRDITITYTGYQKITITNQIILAGQTSTVDANLSSTVVELTGITVAGESEVLLPRDQTVSKQRLTSERMEEIPAQRLEDMLIMEAGVQIGGRDAIGRSLRIRGGRLGEETMVVDGVMVRNFTADPFRQGQGWIYDQEVGSKSEDVSPMEFSTSSVEEVDIITGGFQAEYGNAQSGIINIVTREGGSQLKVDIRYTTDEVMPRTADWGYNQMQLSVGGPVSPIPNLYFHLSGEVQDEDDRSYTHASEGFRAIDQTFVDRLNGAVRNDPILGPQLPVYTLEMLETGHQSYMNLLQSKFPELYDANNPLHQESLFSAPNPVRLPSNWGDRTLGAGKLTYSPMQGLKFIGSINRYRYQHSYPNGWGGDGNYFQTGLFYKGDLDWDKRDWGADTVLHVPQSLARKARTSNLLFGADWEIFRSAERSMAVQLRYTNVRSVENTNSSIKNNWERDTFLGFAVHDVPFEIERFPNREGPPDGDLSWYPDGSLGWKMGVFVDNPFLSESYTAYYLNYNYLRETQNNYKADLDVQINRYNRAKLGFQFTQFKNFTFRTDYRATERNALNEFRYAPVIWGTYLQNRTDIGDFVIDYGVRLDGYVPRDNWSLSAMDFYGQDVNPQVKTEWSPRFDVAFPVTEKTQLRMSYGVFTQLPGLNTMFSGGNKGDIGYSRTDAFEAGISYLLSDDMVLDLVSYYRDVDGNIANKDYFRDWNAWADEERWRGWSYGVVNRDSGNIKGLDLKLQRRFSNNFAFNMMYTMQFSRTTGSAPNTPNLRIQWEEMYDPATGERYIPPDELRPIDTDRAHKFTYQFNYLFPEDFQVGTLANTILKNFRTFAAFSLQSGEPLLYLGPTGNYHWTRADNASLTQQVRGYNFFRGRWYVNLDLRFTKTFRLGQTRRLSLFADIFNAANRKNKVSYPSGITYEGYDNVTAGVDLNWETGIVAQDANRPRFNADFDGDGILTVYEAALGDIARSVMLSTMDKRRWGPARRIRFGVDFSF